MDRQPTKEDLDRLPTRRPILVIDLSGHTAVANSRALELAGIPPLTVEQNADALAAAHREMAGQGITSYLDASTGETELAALAALADRGPLPIRPSAAILVNSRRAADPATLLARLEEQRARHARAGVTIRTVKMFFDGVIEHPTQTAALLEPYLVNRGTKRRPRWVPGKSRGPTCCGCTRGTAPSSSTRRG